MMKLPPVLPDTSYRSSTILGRDHYIRFATCDYSVHPKAIGRRVEIQADLEWVVVRLKDEEVARHRRSLASHRTITAVDHARARREIKEERKRVAASVPTEDVEERDLSVYDRLFEEVGP